MRIPSGVTDQYIYFVAVDATDFATRETGLSTFTVYRSRNGGAAAAMTTPTINETDSTNMPGVYELLLDEDMTIDSGDDSQEMVFHITHAGMAPVTRTIEIYRPKITAGYTLGVESDGDLTKVNTLHDHTAQTGDSYALIGAAGAGLTAIPWSASWDAEVQSEVTDALAAYDAPTNTQLASAVAPLALEATLTTVAGYIDTEITAILDDTSTAIPAAIAALPTATEIADAYLDRDMAAGADTNARSPRNAMRFLRNKYSIAGTTLTITKEDDSTVAWTAELTTSAGASPVIGSDPA